MRFCEIVVRAASDRCPTPDFIPRADGEVRGIKSNEGVQFERTLTADFTPGATDRLKASLGLLQNSSPRQIIT
jgi:hypothetical protein